jgi:hypothetical protein
VNNDLLTPALRLGLAKYLNSMDFSPLKVVNWAKALIVKGDIISST